MDGRLFGNALAKKLGIKPDTVVLAMDAPADYASLVKPVPAGAAIVTKAMTIDGAIWVSWYKKAAKIETDVTEDAIRARALKTDLVDVKVCAVSDVWSGLKLVARKHLR